MEDESPSSSTLYKISRLLTKTADGFEKMAKRGKFSDSESGTATTESDDRQSILARADRFQKKMRRKGTKAKDSVILDSDQVFITACRMEECRGVFSRCKHPYIEVDASRCDGYRRFAENAARKCKVPYEENKELCLFKLNGARILDEPIHVKNKNGKICARPWTIGNYLLRMKKSPAACKIGVAYADYLTGSSSESAGETDDDKRGHTQTSDQESPGDHKKEPITVRYLSSTFIRERKFPLPLTREYIWCEIKSGHVKDMGVYQPEDDGYCVVSIQKGDTALLSPIINRERKMIGYVVNHKPKDQNEFCVACQSPVTVSVNNLKEPITLYCISSQHIACSYSWKVISGQKRVLPSSPVIYVNKEGVFQCTMTYESRSISGHAISVLVDVDSELSDSDSDRSLICTGVHRQSRPSVQLPPLSPPSVQPPHRSTPSVQPPHRSTPSVQPPHRSPPSVQPPPLSPPSVQPPHQSTPSVQPPHRSTPSVQPPHRSVQPLSSQQISDATSHSVLPNQPSTQQLSQLHSQRKEDESMDFDSFQGTSEFLSLTINTVMQFSEEEMSKATRDFSKDLVLGSGGFGVVYKGIISGTYVAVKKLTEMSIIIAVSALQLTPQDGAIALCAGRQDQIPFSFSLTGQLQSEIKALSKCRHRNLVDLVGFCANPPILTYEFMEHGNLSVRLFDKVHPPLSWCERSRILKDVCRGLAWLHGSNPPMVHGDVKSCNVLLDRHLTAKLGDFGFTQEVKLVAGRTMITAAVVAKSLGYCPPEKDVCHISPKSDVYSYGIVALETYSGQEAYLKTRPDPMLIEHLDEQRKSFEGYKSIADPKAGEIAAYLIIHYQKIVEHCVLKHSKRPESNQVMQWWNETNF